VGVHIQKTIIVKMVSEPIIISLVGICGTLIGVIIGTWMSTKLNQKTNRENIQFKEKKEIYEKIIEFLREIAHDYGNLPYTPSEQRLLNIKHAYWNFLKINYVKYNYLSKKVAKEFFELDDEINFLPIYLDKEISNETWSRISENFKKRRDKIEKLIKGEIS